MTNKNRARHNQQQARNANQGQTPATSSPQPQEVTLPQQVQQKHTHPPDQESPLHPQNDKNTAETPIGSSFFHQNLTNSPNQNFAPTEKHDIHRDNFSQPVHTCQPISPSSDGKLSNSSNVEVKRILQFLLRPRDLEDGDTWPCNRIREYTQYLSPPNKSIDIPPSFIDFLETDFRFYKVLTERTDHISY
ncbi:MAG: hypothetical protein AAGG81_03655 [Chlamydiota bacterium]